MRVEPGPTETRPLVELLYAMSYVNASTSVVLVATAAATSNIVYFPNISTTGRLVTVRDNEGFASATNPIILSTIDSARFVGSPNPILIAQPFGFVTLESMPNGGYNILNTFAFPPGQSVAYVSNVIASTLTAQTGVNFRDLVTNSNLFVYGSNTNLYVNSNQIGNVTTAILNSTIQGLGTSGYISSYTQPPEIIRIVAVGQTSNTVTNIRNPEGTRQFSINNTNWQVGGTNPVLGFASGGTTIAYNPAQNLYVAAGNNDDGSPGNAPNTGYLQWSVNGQYWQNSLTVLDRTKVRTKVSYANGLWHAVGSNPGGGTSTILYSTNGSNWTPVNSNTLFPGGVATGITYGNSVWVASGNAGVFGSLFSVLWSSDGSNWNPATSVAWPSATVTDVLFTGSNFAAVIPGAGTNIAVSLDGKTWTTTGVTGANVNGAGRFLATNYTLTLLTSGPTAGVGQLFKFSLDGGYSWRSNTQFSNATLFRPHYDGITWWMGVQTSSNAQGIFYSFNGSNGWTNSTILGGFTGGGYPVSFASAVNYANPNFQLESTVTGLQTVLAVSTLTADSFTVNQFQALQFQTETLVASTVVASKSTFTQVGFISSLQATYISAAIGVISSLSTSHLDASTAFINSLTVNSFTANSFNISTATIENLSTQYISTNEIYIQFGEADTFYGTTLSTQYLEAHEANVSTIVTSEVFTTYLESVDVEATSISTLNLQVDEQLVGSLVAGDALIIALSTNIVSSLTVHSGSILATSVTSGTIATGSVTAVSVAADNVTVSNTLDAVDGVFVNVTADLGIIESIDMLNATTSSITFLDESVIPSQEYTLNVVNGVLEFSGLYPFSIGSNLTLSNIFLSETALVGTKTATIPSKTIKRSTDGINWQNAAFGTFAEIGTGVGYRESQDLYIATGVGQTKFQTLKTSGDNGLTWTDVPNGGFQTSSNFVANGIAWNEAKSVWVAAGQGPTQLSTLMVSTDGLNWRSSRTGGFPSLGNAVTSADANGFLAVGVGANATGTILRSVDGSNWLTTVGGGFSAPLSQFIGRGVAHNGSYGVAVGKDTLATKSIQKSTTALGTNWSPITSGGFRYSGFLIETGGCGVAWSQAQNKWVAVGYGVDSTGNNYDARSSIQVSTDGLNWVPSSNGGFPGGGFGVTYSSTLQTWVAVGSGEGGVSSIQNSTDGFHWAGVGTFGFSSNYGGIAGLGVIAESGLSGSLVAVGTVDDNQVPQFTYTEATAQYLVTPEILAESGSISTLTTNLLTVTTSVLAPEVIVSTLVLDDDGLSNTLNAFEGTLYFNGSVIGGSIPPDLDLNTLNVADTISTTELYLDYISTAIVETSTLTFRDTTNLDLYDLYVEGGSLYFDGNPVGGSIPPDLDLNTLNVADTISTTELYLDYISTAILETSTLTFRDTTDETLYDLYVEGGALYFDGAPVGGGLSSNIELSNITAYGGISTNTFSTNYVYTSSIDVAELLYAPGLQVYQSTIIEEEVVITNFTAVDSYTVPAGVTSLHIEMWGCGGENKVSATGGYGAYISGDLAVSPLDSLGIMIGTPGLSSQVSIENGVTLVAVAGSGGSAGTNGSGIGNLGGNGGNAGAGATLPTAGFPGSSTSVDFTGGSGGGSVGGLSSGGAGGIYTNPSGISGDNGEDGGSLFAGDGGGAPSNAGAGGAGGVGDIGGGGGGGGADDGASSGGGGGGGAGGSSYTGPLTNVVTATGIDITLVPDYPGGVGQPNNGGFVRISYTIPKVTKVMLESNPDVDRIEATALFEAPAVSTLELLVSSIISENISTHSLTVYGSNTLTSLGNAYFATISTVTLAASTMVVENQLSTQALFVSSVNGQPYGGGGGLTSNITLSNVNALGGVSTIHMYASTMFVTDTISTNNFVAYGSTIQFDTLICFPSTLNTFGAPVFAFTETTPNIYSYIVPANVYKIYVELWGAGGRTSGGTGGYGAYVGGYLDVTPGETLSYSVAHPDSNITQISRGATLLAVAGSGGEGALAGSSLSLGDGGNAGIENGSNGVTAGNLTGAGGGGGGYGATSTGPGAGGEGGIGGSSSGVDGVIGSGTVGGNGGSSSGGGEFGGRGGNGYYGGGGGGQGGINTGSTSAGGGGGGGGSSYLGGITNTTVATGSAIETISANWSPGAGQQDAGGQLTISILPTIPNHRTVLTTSTSQPIQFESPIQAQSISTHSLTVYGSNTLTSLGNAYFTTLSTTTLYTSSMMCSGTLCTNSLVVYGPSTLTVQGNALFETVYVSSLTTTSSAPTTLNGLQISQSSNTNVTQNFDGYNSIQTWVVPAGVTSIFVQLWGVGGNDGSAPFGGEAGYGAQAGYVQGTLLVTPGDILTIELGSQGPGKVTSIRKNGSFAAVAGHGGSGGTGGDENGGNGGEGGGLDGLPDGSPGINGGNGTGGAVGGGFGGGGSLISVGSAGIGGDSVTDGVNGSTGSGTNGGSGGGTSSGKGGQGGNGYKGGGGGGEAGSDSRQGGGGGGGGGSSYGGGLIDPIFQVGGTDAPNWNTSAGNPNTTNAQIFFTYNANIIQFNTQQNASLLMNTNVIATSMTASTLNVNSIQATSVTINSRPQPQFQFGSGTTLDTGSVTTISFTPPFTNIPTIVVSTQDSLGSYILLYNNNTTTTSFDAVCTDGTGGYQAVNFTWIAIANP
jgi:hypothetical protein